MPSPLTPPKIGLLDSGVGGLSVLRSLRTLLPSCPVEAIADSRWCPYGPKPAPLLRARLHRLCEFLLTRNVDLIVLACNSATISAIAELRADFDLPLVGMEPGIKPAVALTRSGVIAVLATEVSLAGEKYRELVARYHRSATVLSRPCPAFVELVEKGELAGPAVQRAITEATQDLLEKKADVFVLGCSHYPFLLPALRHQLPPEVHLLETGPAVARQVARRLEELGHALPPTSPPDPLHLWTSGSPAALAPLLPRLLPAENPTLRALPSALCEPPPLPPS